MSSAIHPATEITMSGNITKDLENDDIESDASCWREVFKTRDTRKMGKTARCLTLFHNLTIMIALLLTLFQFYEAASISLVASMVALFRVQQEEDEKFDSEDLCVAEVQQTTRPSSPRRKRRKKRKIKKKRDSNADRHQQTLESGRQTSPTSITCATKEIKESVVPNVAPPPTQPEYPSKNSDAVTNVAPPSKQPGDRPKQSDIVTDAAPPLKQPEDPSKKSDTVMTVDNFVSDEDTMAEDFDDEVAKFRARLETVQSSPDRPKIRISAGVFAKQLAAKKSAASSRSPRQTSFSI